MEEWRGLDWRRRERGGHQLWNGGRSFYTRSRQAERITVSVEWAITCRGSMIFFVCFFLLSITKIAFLPDLALPVALGTLKKWSESNKQKETIWDALFWKDQNLTMWVYLQPGTPPDLVSHIPPLRPLHLTLRLIHTWLTLMHTSWTLSCI